MHALLLVFTLHFGDDHSAGDRWFAPDKAKHFFMAAFVQNVSFGGLRSVGVGRSWSLAGASAITSAVSVGKEVHDAASGGSASLKDLTWDAAGLVAATALLQRAKP
jgi:uncharacterized protein YfiM (DUF2279 family)